MKLNRRYNENTLKNKSYLLKEIFMSRYARRRIGVYYKVHFYYEKKLGVRNLYCIDTKGNYLSRMKGDKVIKIREIQIK